MPDHAPAHRAQALKLLRDLRGQGVPTASLPRASDILSVSYSVERREVTDGSSVYQQYEPSKVIYAFRLRGRKTQAVEVLL